MRNWIFFQICYGVFLWIATLVAFATGNHVIKVIASAVGVLALFVSFAGSLDFFHLYSRDWFKSKKQLDDEIEKSRESWRQAEKLSKIIGQHEAVKLWNEKKDLTPE